MAPLAARGEGRRVRAGDGGRAHQPAAGGRGDPRRGPGRPVRHDPRADLRPRDAGQGARGPASTTSAPASAATRPASGTSTPGKPISCIQHPGDRARARVPLRRAGSCAASRDLPRRAGRRRRAGRAEGGGGRGASAGHRVTLYESAERGSAGRRCSPSGCRAARSSAASIDQPRARGASGGRRDRDRRSRWTSRRCVSAGRPDVVVVATGAVRAGRRLELDGRPDRARRVGRARRRRAVPDGRVVVADWRVRLGGPGRRDAARGPRGRRVTLAVVRVPRGPAAPAVRAGRR